MTLEELTNKKLLSELQESMEALFMVARRDELRMNKRIILFNQAKEKGYLIDEDRVHINRVIILLNDYSSIISTMNSQLSTYRDLVSDKEYDNYYNKIGEYIGSFNNYEYTMKLMEKDFKDMYTYKPEKTKIGRKVEERKSDAEVKNDAKEDEITHFKREK